MNAADRLRRLFKYDDWANQMVLSRLEEHKGFEYAEKSGKLMSHLVASQELWYRRIKGLKITSFEIWPDYSPEEQQEKSKVMHSKWMTLIGEYENDLDVIISYKNSSGTNYETMLSDLLHHLVIHGQHHRAQIAVWLRESGIKPPSTDFIFYTRRN